MHSRNSYSSSGNINARQKYLYKEITSSSPINHNTNCLPETQTSLYEKVHSPTHSHIDVPTQPETFSQHEVFPSAGLALTLSQVLTSIHSSLPHTAGSQFQGNDKDQTHDHRWRSQNLGLLLLSIRASPDPHHGWPHRGFPRTQSRPQGQPASPQSAPTSQEPSAWGWDRLHHAHENMNFPESHGSQERS